MSPIKCGTKQPLRPSLYDDQGGRMGFGGSADGLECTCSVVGTPCAEVCLLMPWVRNLHVVPRHLVLCLLQIWAGVLGTS
jgi:hypothetical protein